jgi:DNA-binding IclR family transcriptional regulator
MFARETMSPIKNKYRIPSLSRACRALKIFASTEERLSSSEIARRLAIPRTTALRILHTLWDEGLLARDGLDFRAGGELLRIGLHALSTLRVRELSTPVLHDLSHRTGETSHLAIQSGQQALIVEVCESPRPVRAASRAGTLVSLHCAATGKVLLAFGCKDGLSDVIDALTLARQTENTIVSATELKAECERIQRQGFAVDNEENYVGVRCLAAPVRNGTGQVVAALGITASTATFTRKRIGEISRQVMLAANDLSKAMGWESGRWNGVERARDERRQ